jgi:hypothetical protein
MRGYIYRSEKRRTGSVLLAAVARAVLGLAVVLGSASTAWGKAPVRRPAVIAHAAGHKIA